jgi:trans-aconitate 2-methyltransferase
MTTFDGWVPSQYNKFAAEREQPFWDLASLVRDVTSPAVADLGCGDGRLTVALGNALGAATILGVDSSRAMIEAAMAHASDRVRFEIGDLRRWAPANSFDVVFANASMQWIPDHRAVLSRWASALRAGGQLAIQIPANADHASHLVAAELAREFLDDPPADVVAQNVLAPEAYVELLYALGFAEQHVRLQVYAHRLSSTAEVVEWMKGTSLTRFKEPLGEAAWEQFVVTYRERLLARLGDQSPYLYPFKRILLWARKIGDGS